jgi:adenine C2-methylase RlmN of 23S rRNA A2503 and tRNA A37
MSDMPYCRVTVSTAGIVPNIRRYVEDSNIRTALAVSLHATTDEVRNWLVPLNKKYNLQMLMEVTYIHPENLSCLYVDTMS